MGIEGVPHRRAATVSPALCCSSVMSAVILVRPPRKGPGEQCCLGRDRTVRRCPRFGQHRIPAEGEWKEERLPGRRRSGVGGSPGRNSRHGIRSAERQSWTAWNSAGRRRRRILAARTIRKGVGLRIARRRCRRAYGRTTDRRHVLCMRISTPTGVPRVLSSFRTTDGWRTETAHLHPCDPSRCARGVPKPRTACGLTVKKL